MKTKMVVVEEEEEATLILALVVEKAKEKPKWEAIIVMKASTICIIYFTLSTINDIQPIIISKRAPKIGTLWVGGSDLPCLWDGLNPILIDHPYNFAL